MPFGQMGAGFGRSVVKKPRRINFPTPATPVVLDPFDADTHTLIGAGASKALDTTAKVQGTGSMKVTGPASNTTIGLDKTYGSLDPTQLGVIAIYFDELIQGRVNSYSLALHRGLTTSNVTFSNAAQFLAGGRWLAAHIDEWPTVKAAGVGALRVRELISQLTPNFAAQVRIDCLAYKADDIPTVVLTFDDGPDTIISTVLPLMQQYGFGSKGSHYVAPSLLGTTGRIVRADLDTLQGAGWSLACDSGMSDEAVPANDGPAALAQVDQVRQWLIGQGLTGAENHMCWSMGTKDQVAADALRGGGFLTARSTEPQSFFPRFGLPPGVAMAIPSQGFTSSTASSVATARLTEIKLRTTTQFFHFHDIKTNPSSIGWQTTKFEGLLGELRTAEQAGQIRVMNLKNWYAAYGAATAP